METTNQRIEIAISKVKIALMLFGALLFVIGGFWFVIPPANSNSVWNIMQKMPVAGYVTILFFGLCSITLILKLFKKTPGLIIDKFGLVDNSSGVSAGQILWSDITSISVLEIYRQKLIMLQVRNPQAYIDKQKNVFKRKMMQLNYKTFGTPLSITSNGLKVSFDELLTDLKFKFEDAKN